MNRSQILLARHHAYLLVSRIFMDGLSADLLPYVRQLPELTALIPERFDQDEEAARHYHIFGHNILPYESIFRDASGLLGGQFCVEVNSMYKASGVDFPYEDDHFGQEVAFLAALCTAEVLAWQTDGNKAADNFAKYQAIFMDRHLLPWLSPFIAALETSSDRFYAALGKLTLSLVADHWRSLADFSHCTVEAQLRHNAPSQLMRLMHEEMTNLKTIAGFLVTPPLSGFYLTLDAIANLARGYGLPRGFGSRHQMLTNLLHSAAQYERLPDVLLGLSETCLTYNQAYRRHANRFADLTPHTEPWVTLVENTTAALGEMINLASEATTSA